MCFCSALDFEALSSLGLVNQMLSVYQNSTLLSVSLPLGLGSAVQQNFQIHQGRLKRL